MIYENDSIQIHLKEGNIFNEPSDILVAPTNCDLKLIGKLSDFSLNAIETFKTIKFQVPSVVSWCDLEDSIFSINAIQ